MNAVATLMIDTTAMLPAPAIVIVLLPAAGADVTVTPVILARFVPLLAFSASRKVLPVVRYVFNVEAPAVAFAAETVLTRNFTETPARRTSVYATMTTSLLVHCEAPPVPQIESEDETTSLKAVRATELNCAAEMPASDTVAST